MGIPGSANLLLFGGEAQAYEIEQSLRFNSGDSHYLNRTPASAGNQKTWTWSGWIKGGLRTSEKLFAASAASDANFLLVDFSSNQLRIISAASGSFDLFVTTQAVYRDPSAWYHLVIYFDAANTTVRIYVNNVEQSLTTTTAISNKNYLVNSAITHRIGRDVRASNTTDYFNGYLAEVNFIDGSALDPTSFGEYDDNGAWRPIRYAGSYTGNSFYLKFASGDGTDSSGLSNTWTANNFTTSGTGTDVMSDTPTTNWCTLNPLAVRPSYVPTFSDGNLKVTHRSGTGQYSHCGSTFAFKSDDSSGFYCEVQNGAESSGGVSLIVTDYGVHNLHPDVSNGFSTNTNGGIGYDSNGYIRNFGTTIDYTGSASYNSGSDILGIAVKDNKVWFSINGTWIASGNPSTGANPVITLSSTQTFVVGSYGQGSRTFIKNFGQRAFAYTVPTGFKAMNTSNLPAPDIADGSDYFNTVLYTGTSSTQSITGIGYQPDFTWVKRRDSANSNALFDAVRGAGERLSSNETTAEVDNTSYFTSFDSDGFSVALNGGETNLSGATYVAWNWLAGGSGSSNTAGSITSTVSANPSAGFSIVSYTGTGNAATVGHGLGVAPSLIIEKNRDLSQNWAVYHSALGATKALILDDNFSEQTATYYWNDTAPTSTVFSIGTWNGVNSNTQKHIAYCFAEVEGYSKFGSYTGNSSTDGVFVYCGFKPAWLLIKRYNVSGAWFLMDSARNTYNVVDNFLYPNTSGVEDSGSFSEAVDFLSNGFKCRTTSGYLNGTGDSYIFVAFASSPFGGSGVSPATAR